MSEMNLEYSHPITMRSDYKFRRSQSQIISIKDQNRKKDTTEKPERVYYLWFLYLKLLLEMEQNKIPLTKGKPQKKFYLGKDIHIDKKFYEEWDLDAVLKEPFHRWKRTHLKLFENPSTTISENPKIGVPIRTIVSYEWI